MGILLKICELNIEKPQGIPGVFFMHNSTELSALGCSQLTNQPPTRSSVTQFTQLVRHRNLQEQRI